MTTKTKTTETENVHDRKCACGKRFTTKAKRGHPFTKCPDCRKV